MGSLYEEQRAAIAAITASIDPEQAAEVVAADTQSLDVGIVVDTAGKARNYVTGKRLKWPASLNSSMTMPPAARSERRPREHRAGTHTRARAPNDDPDPEPSSLAALSQPPAEVASRDTDLNRVWREALDRFETREEFRTLARLAVIRARAWWAA